MGLFGALYAGVSGLDSQSNKIGIISNNISNVNTIGYKQGQANFDTLVVPSGTTTFSPGGVISGNTQLVNQQGTISGTTSSTASAISGNGFYVVSSSNESVGQGGTELYTRAGDFTQDSEGNFVNSTGYFLQGVPITTPATQLNSANLQTVKISQSATGSPTATSTVSIQANLNAAQTVFPGGSRVATLSASNGTSPVNANIASTKIILGNDVPTTANGGANLTRGDSFSITSTPGSGTPVVDTYTYGGFSIGRSANTSSNNIANATPATPVANGDGAQVLKTDPLAAGALTNDSTGGANGTITVTVPGDAADYVAPAGYGFISISGITTAINGILPANLNGEFPVTQTGPNTLTFQAANGATGVNGVTASSAQATTASNRTASFTGNVLNATSSTTDFLTNGAQPLSTANFTSQALNLKISVDGNTPVTLSYSSSADPTNGTFNNLQTLAEAISDQPGLTATVSTDGRLYVSGTNPNNSVKFTNGDSVGNTGVSPALNGINWVQELGLTDSTPTPAPQTYFFNSLASLANDINGPVTSGGDQTNLTATIANPNAASTLTMTEANPEQTIQFTDNQTTGSVLKELGIANISPAPAGGLANTTGVIPITYNASNTSTDLSSGGVTPQFSKDITVYDSEGFSHTLALNFVKTSTNTWGVEVTAVPASDVTNTSTTAVDGQVASGTLNFTGTGALGPVSGSITSPITIDWKNGAGTSQISLDLGELGTAATDGSAITQTAGPSTVSSVVQNGAPTGELTGVTIDDNGFVTASFSNGQTQQLYQVPLAVINNPDGLLAVSGNAYQQTVSSGEPTLDYAGEGGAGTFTPSALEQSNVDLSTQLTDLIVAQQAYGANSKVLTVADSLLQELDQIIQ